MGDSMKLTGRMKIVPPLPWGRFRAILAARDDRAGGVLQIEETAEQVDTDEGELTRRTAVAVVPTRPGDVYGPHGKVHHLESDLANLFEAVLAEGSELEGYFYTSEDGGYTVRRWWFECWSPGATDPLNRWRLADEEALLVWPDGSAALDEKTYEFTGDGRQWFREPARPRED
jgi:hypothetical protein